ncbi:carbohydrate ABC transporter permease [Bifidobacterium pullorum]|uniref:carbohydrate ABC transporter permease n=1 Tax=Bifidobacterium pullorum TaxID=78448 RepID=UPI0024ADBE60|nr:carbohydrate ABC transporter permease [Bifidobacterium pullorum]
MSAATRSASLKRRDEKLAIKDHKLRVKKQKNTQNGIPVQLTPTQKILNVLLHLVMLLMVVYCLVPLIWLVFSSTKTNDELYTANAMWFGDHFALWDNIVQTFTFEDGEYGRWLINTLVYAAVAGLGATLFATFAGYAIATMKFHGRKALLWVTLLFMSIPSTVITVPLFLLYSKMGLTGTPLAVIVPQLSNPFGLYLMIIYAQTSIPISLVEAARIDGANTWTIFWKIAFPLLSPGFVTTLLFALVGTWNNYFLPLIMLNDVRDYPLTVGLNVWMKMAGDASYHVVPNNMILTGSLIAVVPLIIAFLFLQKYWQSGLAAGAVKQ